MESTEETWLPVIGWEEFYEVSDQGRIRSLPRTVERFFRWGCGKHSGIGKLSFPGKVISIYRDKDRSTVRISGGGRRATKAIHRLVAAAFLGPRPDGAQVAHNNGNPHDNRVSNLRYATPAENCADKRRHGTYLAGESCPNSKLTEEQVRFARSLPKGKIGEYAKEIGIKPATLYQVRQRDTWRHI